MRYEEMNSHLLMPHFLFYMLCSRPTRPCRQITPKCFNALAMPSSSTDVVT